MTILAVSIPVPFCFVSLMTLLNIDIIFMDEELKIESKLLYQVKTYYCVFAK